MRSMSCNEFPSRRGDGSATFGCFFFGADARIPAPAIRAANDEDDFFGRAILLAQQPKAAWG